MAMMAMTTNSSIRVNARRRVSFLSQASDLTILTFLINALGCCRSRRLLGFGGQIIRHQLPRQLCVSRHTFTVYEPITPVSFHKPVRPSNRSLPWESGAEDAR